jgi:molecular chaperone IbpA
MCNNSCGSPNGSATVTQILLNNRRLAMSNSKQLRITSELLNPLYKMSVGFDRLADEFFNDPLFTNASATGYPPFNINKIINTQSTEPTVDYEIVLALAGFTEKDIEIVVENNNMRISGKSGCLNLDDAGAHEEVHYLHKGIAERSFSRTFKLAEHVEVKSASLKNGILRVRLWRNVPEAAKPKLIAITAQ